jgi:tricarboxylate carrier
LRERSREKGRYITQRDSIWVSTASGERTLLHGALDKRDTANITANRTLFTSSAGLEQAKSLIVDYKKGKLAEMTPELWTAKKTIDSTLHPGSSIHLPLTTEDGRTILIRCHADTGEPVLLPFRMSAFIFSNLIVTAGMLTPGLGTAGTAGWQVANQSLNVAINSSNANKSTPLSTSKIVQSYFMAVGASCGVALGLKALVPRLKVSPAARTVLGRLVPFAAVASAGALNVFLMRGEEIRLGIPVYPTESVAARAKREAANEPLQPLGKSKKAATLAVGETAISRVLNATPIMVLPPLILVRLQQTAWLQQRPKMVTPVNLGLIFATSIFALPLALAAFPQRQAVQASSLEKEFWELGGEGGLVEFNRGI